MPDKRPASEPVGRSIDIAMGVLMHQQTCTAEAAGVRLHRMAAHAGRPVEQVADLVVSAAEIGCELNCVDEDD